LGDPIVQPVTKAGAMDGIPTGLMVAGFLSNVAMMPLDQLTDGRLSTNNRVAHFRFVDDHIVLAYEFQELTAWISQYRDALKRLEIGPQISPTKYEPPELGLMIEGTATGEEVAEGRAKSKIDGSHPAKLMTKTLALVSDLAGTGFDILAEQSREQRLSELEWLLVADLPDHEIRADTRAAFAAGRISALVPIAFSPTIDLLESRRTLIRLESAPELDAEAIAEAKRYSERFKSAEWAQYQRRIDHYFKLMFQAFRDHPDKPRLFIRILDYCRTTGQTGTLSLLKWTIDHSSDVAKPLADYLRPLAIQTISRHLVTSAFDLSNRSILARQRRAARSYLRSLIRPRARTLLRQIFVASGDDLASVTARNTMCAAIACAAEIVGSPSLNKNLTALAETWNIPPLLSASAVWGTRTGSPIGVWAHWLDSLHSTDDGPGRIWRLTSTKHDPHNLLDWANLRKGPRLFPRRASMFLDQNPLIIKRSDAGWLLDQQASPSPVNLDQLENPSSAARLLRRHFAELAKKPNMVTLEVWVSNLAELSPYDPRVGEWSALEVVRQLLASVRAFPTGSLDDLDDLHPSNILVPKTWLALRPPDDFSHTLWTWESWKQIARAHSPSVEVTKSPIADYRRQSGTSRPREPEYLWLNRLRATGLLLLGLSCRNFTLPSAWNVRGSERDIGYYVKSKLENIPISSRTQAIIEAALLPRSAETSIIRHNPWAFFGARASQIINDTRTDPPLIPDIMSLLDEILMAQKVLESSQISVLNHAARQLVPMNVVQLMGVAVPMFDTEDD
jgi:hypothetical protein